MATDQKKIKEDMQLWIEAVNSRDLERIDRLADEFYAADFVFHDPGVPDIGRGPSGIKQFTQQFLQRSPDMQMSIADMFGEGDRLAVRVMCSRTDASTGKRMSFMVMWIIHYAGNKRAEGWELAGPPAESPA